MKQIAAFLKIPVNIIFFFRRSFRSNNFSRRQKRQLFSASISLYFKSLLYGDSKKAEVSQNILGCKIYGYSYKSLSFLMNEVIIFDEYYFKSGKKDPVIIDCGGNIGMSVLYFKTLFPAARIICFEPDPRTFSFLKKNVEINDFKNVDLYNKAISGEEGTLPFFIEDFRAGITSSLLRSRGGERSINVETLLLSKLINKYKPDCIKIDTEGAEAAILGEVVKANAIKDVGQWLIEYHHKIEKNKSTFSQFLLPFEQNGFEYNIKASYARIGEFQDISIHFYKPELY